MQCSLGREIAFVGRENVKKIQKQTKIVVVVVVVVVAVVVIVVVVVF